MTDKKVTVDREPSVIALAWCKVCRQWMKEGSREAGKCVTCGTRRGD